MLPRRRLLKAFAAAGLFGPAGISGLIRDALAKGDAPPGMRALRGDVTVNSRLAREGQLVSPGDTVTTGRDSEAVYVIGRDAFLQRQSSVIAFSADAGERLMRVATGKILSVFGRGTRTIKVSTATIGIRGTGCYIEDEGSGAAARTYFCLCYGSVELIPAAAPQEREQYSAAHHDKPMYIYNDMSMPRMMVPAGVINHSDDELKLLESLVGRLPPFLGQGGPKY